MNFITRFYLDFSSNETMISLKKKNEMKTDKNAIKGFENTQIVRCLPVTD